MWKFSLQNSPKNIPQVNILPITFSNTDQVSIKNRNTVKELKITIYSHKSFDLTANYQPKTLSGNSLIIYYVKINGDILITHLRLHKAKHKSRRHSIFHYLDYLRNKSWTTGNGKKEKLEMTGSSYPNIPCLTLKYKNQSVSGKWLFYSSIKLKPQSTQNMRWF